jgi:phosphatidate cytidylyltransferase
VPWAVDVISVMLTVGLYVIGYLALRGVIPVRLIGIYLLGATLIGLILLVVIPQFSTIDLGHLFTTMLYCSLGFLGLTMLRASSVWMLVYVLLIAILTDTAAYFFGIRFGRHRLAEKISPKKSVEGAVSGLVIGGGLGAVFAIAMSLFSFSFVWVIGLSFVLSFLAQVGDLVASKFKRDHDIKDFSQLLPGHGGILDRFDSWIFAALSMFFIGLMIEAIFPSVQVF